uniref:Uncharacterized protein n=1 Tax=Arundo donax TaxID=35708 RepID=A0A0A9CA34_ARUDO
MHVDKIQDVLLLFRLLEVKPHVKGHKICTTLVAANNISLFATWMQIVQILQTYKT